MKDYNLLYLPGMIFILMPVIYAIFKSNKEAKKQRIREFIAMTNRCNQALGYKTADPIKNYMAEYTALYEKHKDVLPPHYHQVYREDMEELKDYLADVERDHWERRAIPHLQEFADCYGSLRDEVLPPAKAKQIKNRCISEWQRYFGVQLDDYETRIYPKRVLREFLGEDYDPCMEEHDRLERRLDQFIWRMKA